MASPYAFDAAAMNSLYRSSRRAISRASWLSLAWERWPSQVATPDVRPPTTDPASADSVERYAISILSALNPCDERAVGNLDRAFASRRSSAGSKVMTPWSLALLVRAAEEGARRLSRIDD